MPKQYNIQIYLFIVIILLVFFALLYFNNNNIGNIMNFINQLPKERYSD